MQYALLSVSQNPSIAFWREIIGLRGVCASLMMPGGCNGILVRTLKWESHDFSLWVEQSLFVQLSSAWVAIFFMRSESPFGTLVYKWHMFACI